jgi:HlyD family secretion protein
MKNKKVLYGLIGGAILLIVVGIAGKKAGWFGDGNVINVAAEMPARRTIIETITASGKVQPATEVKISSEVSGEIVELFVREGDRVKAGDLLLRINADIYQSSLEQMKASLNSSRSGLENSRARLTQAKASYTQAQLSYNRSKKLWEQKTISESEWESAQAAYETAGAELEASKQSVKGAEYGVESAAASLKQATDQLRKTSIYAPMEGTISSLSVEKGERVVGTAQMAGTELLRIANLHLMEVVMDVNENDIIRVKNGDTAIIEIDAYLKEKFKGLVTEVASSASNLSASSLSTDQVTNFEVKVLILASSYQHLMKDSSHGSFPFRPGMSATVDIITRSQPNVLSIPIQAVTTRTDTLGGEAKKEKSGGGPGGPPQEEEEETVRKASEVASVQEMVFVLVDGKVLRRKVKTGIQDSNFIEVLEGLTVIDEVIVAPYSAISRKLEEGKVVKKVEKKDLYNEK